MYMFMWRIDAQWEGVEVRESVTEMVTLGLHCVSVLVTLSFLDG